MMNMMTATGMNYATGVFWLHLHWFFGVFAIVGFILLAVWALRSLQKEQLKTFAVWLLIFGIVGSLITVAPAMAGKSWLFSKWRGGHMEWKGMHQMMMDHDEDPDDEDHEEMLEMMERMMR